MNHAVKFNWIFFFVSKLVKILLEIYCNSVYTHGTGRPDGQFSLISVLYLSAHSKLQHCTDSYKSWFQYIRDTVRCIDAMHERLLPSINVRNIFVQRLDIEIFQSKHVQQLEDMRPLFILSVICKRKILKFPFENVVDLCHDDEKKKSIQHFHSQGHTLIVETEL